MLEEEITFLVDLAKKGMLLQQAPNWSTTISTCFESRKRNESNPYRYYSDYYTKDTLLVIYKSTIYPVKDESTWDLSEKIQRIKVLPPEGRAKLDR